MYITNKENIRCVVRKFVLTKTYFISYLSNLQAGVKDSIFIFIFSFSICLYFFTFISIKSDAFRVICNYTFKSARQIFYAYDFFSSTGIYERFFFNIEFSRKKYDKLHNINKEIPKNGYESKFSRPNLS